MMEHLLYYAPVDFDVVWSGLANQKDFVNYLLGAEWVMRAKQRGVRFRTECLWQYDRNQIAVSIWVLCPPHVFSWLALTMQPQTYEKSI